MACIFQCQKINLLFRFFSEGVREAVVMPKARMGEDVGAEGLSFGTNPSQLSQVGTRTLKLNT